MACKTIRVSDQSGNDLEEGKGVTVRVVFADARKGVRELDLTGTEAEKLGGRAIARRGRKPKGRWFERSRMKARAARAFPFSRFSRSAGCAEVVHERGDIAVRIHRYVKDLTHDEAFSARSRLNVELVHEGFGESTRR